MTRHLHGAATVLAALVLAPAMAGCHRDVSEPGESSPTTGATAASPSATPADHLAPDELVEGPEKAFDMPLPRGVTVERAQLGSVRAIGPVAVHPLVKYFDAHISQGRKDEGDRFATFTDVRLSGHPGVQYRIRLTALPPRGTLVEIDDVTPPPAPDLPDVPARWRQVGLTPNGRVVDPTHLD